MNSFEIIIKPVITEKTTAQMEKGKYTFIVDYRASAEMVRNAVEEIFSVKVKSVNVGRVYGKRKRTRWSFSKTPEHKKAIVTLHPGHKIEIVQNA